MKGSCFFVVVVMGLVFVSLLSCFVVVECRGEECLKEERSLLLQLKNSINITSNEYSRHSLSNWKGRNCCRWYGVVCSNSTSRVNQLLLKGVRMGEVTIWYPNVTMLAQFKELQHLDMSYNEMGGSDATLQAFCRLPHLKHLDLSYNLLKGNIPQCFGDLKLLQVLRLDSNELKGNIPFSTFSSMHSLQELNLLGNHLQGTISPSTFRNMHFLKVLDLSVNQLRGTISPSTFRNMHSLEKLDLSHNQIQGTISPSTFSNLTMIAEIYLSDNLLVGHFPFSMFANLSKLFSLDLSNNYQLEVETELPTWVPKFQLINLYLANCKLNSHSGSISPSFISTHHSLRVLDLSSNSLLGDIPSWLLYNFTYFLWLRNNSFGGQFPLPSQNTTSSLQLLDISNNFVYGSLPVNFVDHFPVLNYFDMSTNALQGNLPPIMGRGNLEWLALSNNSFSGEIPSSLMRNIKHGLLDLSNNIMQGEMLPTNSSMEGLMFLKLDGNEFTIPPNISKVPNLRILNIGNNHLSGNISSWLQVHHNLTVLFLGRNHFEGPIPWQICRMKSLRYLDLSNSSLGGTIPSCLASIPSWKSIPPIDNYFNSFPNLIGPSKDIPIALTSKGISYNYIGRPAHQMTLIDLSMNSLSGTIPFEIGNMTGVKALNLSHNLLEGPLPVSFQHMKNVESLDLSHNNLNGTIPDEITELDSLTTFTVAFNNLSGEIPYQGKLFTFNDSSYEGNPGLCGKPLNKNCSSDEVSGGRGGGGEEHAGIVDSDLFFYSCIAISYCMGFWGFIAFLFFNKNSRRKFFGIVDALQDWSFEIFWRVVCHFRS